MTRTKTTMSDSQTVETFRATIDQKQPQAYPLKVVNQTSAIKGVGEYSPDACAHSPKLATVNIPQKFAGKASYCQEMSQNPHT